MRGVNSSYEFYSQTKITNKDWSLEHKIDQVAKIDQPTLFYDKTKQMYVPRPDATKHLEVKPSEDSGTGLSVSQKPQIEFPRMQKAKRHHEIPGKRTAIDCLFSKVPI